MARLWRASILGANAWNRPAFRDTSVIGSGDASDASRAEGAAEITYCAAAKWRASCAESEKVQLQGWAGWAGLVVGLAA